MFQTSYPGTTIYKDRRGEFRWATYAGNNRTIGASTEGFKNKRDCISNATMIGVSQRQIVDRT